jgi:hypothetical protein
LERYFSLLVDFLNFSAIILNMKYNIEYTTVNKPVQVPTHITLKLTETELAILSALVGNSNMKDVRVGVENEPILRAKANEANDDNLITLNTELKEALKGFQSLEKQASETSP